MGGDGLTIHVDALQSKVAKGIDSSVLCQQHRGTLYEFESKNTVIYTHHVAHPLSKFLRQFPKW